MCVKSSDRACARIRFCECAHPRRYQAVIRRKRLCDRILLVQTGNTERESVALEIKNSDFTTTTTDFVF